MVPSQRGLVADYYDRNTTRFLRYGHGGETLSIHRAVWGPDVADRAHALRYVENLISAELEGLDSSGPAASGPRLVADLGCGVGGSMLYLASLPSADGARFVGVTISGAQAELGRRLAAAAGLGARIRLVHGDYTSEGLFGLGSVDLAYAVESFLHLESPGEFFDAVAPVLRRGGRVVICDDFLSDPRHSTRPLVETFRRGWHAANLVSSDAVTAEARKRGLVLRRNIDLSSYLELNRPRDLLIRGLMPLLRSAYQAARSLVSGSRGSQLLAAYENVWGGDALQRCLLRGYLRYRFLVYERSLA